MTLNGHVEKGVFVLHNGDTLPEGTLVQVTPLSYEAGNPLAAGLPRCQCSRSLSSLCVDTCPPFW